MADPYLPPQPGSYDPARVPRDPVQVEPSRPIPAPAPSRSGLGTGLMVALVFVVVAILAAALFRQTTPELDATVPSADVAPEAAPADDNAGNTGTAPVQPEAGAEPADPALDPAADPAVEPETGTAEPATPPASGTVNP